MCTTVFVHLQNSESRTKPYVVDSDDPSTGEQRQGDQKFKAVLSYQMSSGVAWATWDPGSQKHQHKSRFLRRLDLYATLTVLGKYYILSIISVFSQENTKPGVVALNHDSSSKEAETGGLLEV